MSSSSCASAHLWYTQGCTPRNPFKTRDGSILGMYKYFWFVQVQIQVQVQQQIKVLKYKYKYFANVLKYKYKYIPITGY